MINDILFNEASTTKEPWDGEDWHLHDADSSEKNSEEILALAEAFEVPASWVEDAVERGISSLEEAIAEKKDFLFRQAMNKL